MAIVSNLVSGWSLPLGDVRHVMYLFWILNADYKDDQEHLYRCHDRSTIVTCQENEQFPQVNEHGWPESLINQATLA